MKYVKILRLFLSLVGAWPGDELGQNLHWLEKCYRTYVPFQCFITALGEIHYMVTNELDFLILGDAFISHLLTNVLLVRLIIPSLKSYREVIRDFFMDFNLMHFKNKGVHFKKVNEIVQRVSLYGAYYMAVLAIFGASLFNIIPIYINYQNGAFLEETKHNITHYASAVYASFPFFNPFEHLKSYTVFVCYCTLTCGVSVCFIDLLVILMAFHIIGHTVILRKNIEGIAGPQNKGSLTLDWENSIVAVHCGVFSEEENRKISVILKDCIDHHRVIIRFAEKMSNFFGFMLAFNYAFQLVGCCILLMESTQGNLSALIRFGPLTLIIFGQLIQISVIFEIVGTVSEKLPDALYAIPWECLNISNQRSVCILLQRLQHPIHVTAMGMTTVGVTTMAGILKTTFSYFAFLRTLNE